MVVVSILMQSLWEVEILGFAGLVSGVSFRLFF